MIIYRYIAKEVLGTMVGVSIILLLIIVSGRFVRYLADAVAGKLDASVLLLLIAYRLPSFMELIIPLGFFIGILLAHGRLHVDSEMTVLSACGMSERQLVGYTMMTACLVAIIVAVFSLYISPTGMKASEALLAEQRSRTEFETLKPGRFHKLSSQDGVSYAQSVSEDKKRLQQVFLARAGDQQETLSVLTAESGETIINDLTGNRYLVLKNGYQYQGNPGEVDYKVVSFSSYSQYVPEPEYQAKSKHASDAMSTLTLLETDTAEAKAALQWRFSLPLLVMIIALLAVPLSRTQPRKGRYVKMIPAILLYIMYLVISNGARGMLEDGSGPSPYILWWVHGGFALLALSLLTGPDIWRRVHTARAS